MPTYDYFCNACEHQFEELQSMSAKHLRKCPVCGKSALKRLIGSGAGIIFKGSGFYQTDYKKSSQDPAAKEKSSPKEAGCGSSTCKSSTDTSSKN